MTAVVRLAAGTVAALLAGCGGGSGTLAGRVTADGKPVVTGTVTVVAADGTVHVGPIRADGSYEVVGVPAGPATVAINSPDRKAKTSMEKAGVASRAADRSGGDNPPGWFPLAPRFADPATSGVGTVVRSGSNQFPIDLR